jgi:hypothetical protein
LEKGPYFSPCSCKQEIGAIYWKGGKIELADVCKEERRKSLRKRSLGPHPASAQPSPPKFPSLAAKSSLQNIFLEITFNTTTSTPTLPPSTISTMGKGKGKKGRHEAKLAAKKAAEVPKIPGAPRPANPVKKAKKLLSREKKSAINTNPPGPEKFPIPMGRPKPFTKSPQHAKWPALFKKHLGLIESHIRALDRVMQSMKSEMGQMPEKERMEWELGERGNWRAICEMMDRARGVLADARKAAQGIVSSWFHERL